MLLGCDLSPEYTPGFDVGAAYATGCRFLAVKLSDGAKGYDRYEEGIDVIAAARDRRMVAVGYHYVRPGVPADEQAGMFAMQLRRAGCPGMLDVESGGPTALDVTRDTHYGVSTLGGWVAFTYLPRWWWTSIGSPTLAGLPPLWASRYVSAAGVETAGAPQQVAAGIDPAGWEPYGGRVVEVLQFTQRATIGKFTMTADMFRGTRADLELLTDRSRGVS